MMNTWRFVFSSLLMVSVIAQLGCRSTSHEYYTSGMKCIGTNGPIAVLPLVVNGRQRCYPDWLSDPEFNAVNMTKADVGQANATLYSWLGSVLGDIKLIPPSVCDSLLSREDASMSFDSAIVRASRKLHTPNVLVLRVRDFISYVAPSGRTYSVAESSLELYDEHARPLWSIRCTKPLTQSTMNGYGRGDLDSYLTVLFSEAVLKELKDMCDD